LSVGPNGATSTTPGAWRGTTLSAKINRWVVFRFDVKELLSYTPHVRVV
jgi:hypothetical protein